MTQLEAVCNSLSRIAPLRLAESWDNVGLLVGDRRRSVQRIMTCLTVTPNVVDEAVEQDVDLIVTHHPIPFQPLSRITSDSITGGMLLRMISKGVAVYSAHTAFDSTVDGINQMWAERLGLHSIQPLVPPDDRESDGIEISQASEASNQETPTDPSNEKTNRDPKDAPVWGGGRVGRLPQAVPLNELARNAAVCAGASLPRIVGQPQTRIAKIAIACGSGGSFLAAARRRGCDAMVTGEATFHTCLEAEASGIGLVLLGHYSSERFAMERLAGLLAEEFADLAVWASRCERDPIRMVDLKH